MAYTSGFTAVTGAVLTAAQWNTNVRDNMTAIWVGTTAGDIDYYTSSTGKSRLALVVGGVLYGGASAPAWAAKPSSSLPQFLKNTSSGVPSYSYPSLFGTRVYNSVDQTVASGANILWDTEFHDDEGLHSTSSNKDRFTIVTTGRYNISGFVWHTGGSTFYWQAYIYRNGTQYLGSDCVVVGSSLDVVLSPIAIEVDLTAGDYVTLRLENSGGVSVTVNGGSTKSHFGIQRCGPY